MVGNLGLRSQSFALLSRWAGRAWTSLARTTIEMARRPETCCVFVAFMFTLFATKPSGFRNADHITIPHHIFQKGSAVLEFVDGNMLVVDELVKHREVDFAMVMFYAHWDGTSLNTSLEFENVARQMSSMDVPFLAVNCWWPYGVCARYRVLNFYPLITVIHQTLGELEYTGLLTAESMMVFLKQVMNPFKHITDESSLKLFCAEHEVSVIGYFNFMADFSENNKDPEGFGSFFKASIRAVIKDPIQPIHFGVVTTERLARILALTHSKETMLRRQLNESLVYPRNLAYKSDLIVSWAYRHRQQAVSWLVPTHRKSLIFSSILTKGPTLLMFTPLQEERTFDNFHLLRTVALDYFNCRNSSNIWDSIEIIHSERQIQKYLGPNGVVEPVLDGASLECCQTLTNNQKVEYLKMSHYNTCEVCEHSSHYQAIGMDNCKVNTASISKSLESFGTHIFSGPNLCLNWLNNYSPFSEVRVCCTKLDMFTGRNRFDHQTKHLQACDCNHVDDTTKTLKDPFHQNLVSQRKLNERKRQQKVFMQGDVHKWSEMTGLGCSTNKTLAFYAVRSDMFWSLAQHLGLKETLDGMRIAAVIIDYKNEVQHVLSSSTLSVDSLRTFVLNYTNNDLQRFLRSLPEVNVPHLDSSSNIYIQEVTTDTFHQIVLNNTQDVILLYYAPWCGYCFRISHLYLSFANLLKQLGLDGILVSRIDGDANDLPWEFTVSTYPTIIFFPVGQSNDSVKLPEKEQITLLSLVKFTLQHTTKSI